MQVLWLLEEFVLFIDIYKAGGQIVNHWRKVVDWPSLKYNI